ncbi:MAG: sulfotransferase [Dokdonella sp.]
MSELPASQPPTSQPAADPSSAAILPEAARAEAQEAVAALSRQQAALAEKHLRTSLHIAPEHPGLLRLLGVALGMQGQHAEAIVSLHRARDGAPDDATIHLSLGNALSAIGDKESAAKSFRRAGELAPDAAPVWFNLAQVLIDSAHSEDAVPVLRRTLMLSPGNLRARFMLADALRVTGALGEAEAEYRGILATHPHSGEAWLGLSGLKNIRFGQAEVEIMQRAAQDPALDEDDQISIRFALARGLEDAQRYAESFVLLSEANARVRKWYPWNASAFSARVSEFIAAFPTSASTSAQTNDLGSEVIFVASMPRSGSSLTEQILASHSQICGAGELGDLPAILHDESHRRGEPFPAWTGKATAADWERLGRTYLERTGRWRAQHTRFTDKLPDNWRFVGAIAAMLPAARIVVCQRDPLETCFSCFRQMFNRGGQAFTYAIDDVAEYWHDFDRATRHWQERYPGQVRIQNYELLVADTEAQVRELLEFCGLDFEDACLRFYETERSVRTASAAQVREPLRRDTARADSYGELLDPLRNALSDR